MTRIIPSLDVDKQILMALETLRPFFPKSLRELHVEHGITSQEGETEDLAQWSQTSGYREATLFVSSRLSDESGATILQVLRHELVHGHLHQLDVFVNALIAACPGNRSRRATTDVYHMLRESIADDISYGLGDVLDEYKQKLDWDRTEDQYLIRDLMVKVHEKGQAIW